MRPPVLARWLLVAVLPARVRAAVLEDLDGRYADQRRPRSWYWTQAFKAIRPALVYRSESTRRGGSRRAIPRRKSRPMESLLQDLRYGVRSVRRSPGFAVVAVVTLALGIGLNVASFAIINGVVLRALPYPDADRLVELWGLVQGERTVWGNASLPDLQDWRAATTSFAALAGYTDTRMTLGGADEPALVEAGRVTEDFFTVLGLEAMSGRVLGSDDFADGADAAAVISERAWRDRFGGDSEVIGSVVRLDEEPYTIVGVLPARRHALPSAATDFWIPEQPGMSRGSRSLSVIGRLAAGVSVPAAQADLDAISATLAAEYPDSNADRSTGVVPLKEIVVGDGGNLLLILFGATGLVLLIGAVNLINLFYSRTFDRRRELSVRTALGASRGHLVRYLGAEAMVLAALGGALGVVVARAAVGAFLALAPADVPRLAEVTVDGTALAFAVAVSFAMALFIGVVPAWQTPVTGGMRPEAASPGRDRRGWLIATEVALSVVLLVGAGLLVRSFVRLQQTDTGFAAEHLVSLRLDLPGSRYPGAAEVIGFHEEMLARIGGLPGVASAGGVTVLPFSGGNLADSIAVDGVEREDIKVEFRSISGDYFPTMGMSLLAGRPVGTGDTRQTAPAAVINRSLAQAAWAGEDPLGRTITIFGDTWNVVGVVSDVRDFGLATPPAPVMYVSFNQQPRRYLTHVVRTAGDPADLIPTLRELVRAADPELPVADVATMSDRVWLSAAAPRFRTGLLGVLAAAALVLAAVGVFSVTSFAVSRRIREVGIRRALGARTGSVIGWVLGRSMRFTVAGAIAGTAVSIALAGYLRGLLFEIEPLDVPTFVIAVAVICAASLAGSLIPALRAAAIDPVAAIGDANESR